MKILWVQTNVTPQLKNFFYYRFDLTKKTPLPPRKIKGNLDLGRFDLTNFDTPPQIKGNLDLGRFDLTNFDLTPPSENFMGANCNPQPFNQSSASSRSLQTQQKTRVTEAQHNAEKHFLLMCIYNKFTQLCI